MVLASGASRLSQLNRPALGAHRAQRWAAPACPQGSPQRQCTASSEGPALLRQLGQPEQVVLHLARRGRWQAGGEPSAVDVAPQGLEHRAAEELHQALQPAGLAVEVADAVVATVRAGQLAALRRRLQRVAVTAQAVDQAALLGLRAGPDAALGHRVDLLRRAAPRRGHLGDEVGVGVVDAALHQRGETRIERAARVEGTAEPGGGDAAGVHTELVERLLGRGQQREHADRSGDGGGIGDHLVGRGGHPVAARGRDVAHRHHHRLAGRARELQFAAHQLGTEGAAAG